MLMDRLLAETARLVSREDLFPKRSRWIIARDLIKLASNAHTCASYANGIRVRCHKDFVDRANAQARAAAWLYALDLKMGAAQMIHCINPDRLDGWAGIYNEAWDYLDKWSSSDRRRYAQKYGELSGQEQAEEAAAVSGITGDPADLGSVNPGNANNVRLINPSGALNNNNNANNRNGGVADRENSK